MADEAAATAATTQTAQTTQAAATTTAATVEPYYKDFLQSDGTLNHKALERLPDHLKGVAPLLQNRKTIDDLLMGYDHANTLASKKALAPLPANAPATVVAERKALLDSINGVPKEAKDYGIVKPKELPDAAWHQGMADGYAGWAHKWSVPPSAAKELMDMNMGYVQQNLKDQAAGETKFWAGEQQRFDAELARSNIPAERADALVQRGAIDLGLNLEDKQTQTFLKGSNARLMALRHAIAIGEDKVIQGGDGRGTSVDPDAEAADIQRNPANPLYAQYWNREGKFSRAQQDAAKEKVFGLLRQGAERRSGKGRAA